ncbi:alpha/beta fold hydrolase [Kribbella sp. NBC_01505]|uniref:thioesterase II family protein n=1 Tax=Kribbella sp. NBC_01505 TaxID=2903580 RepID=UPI00386C61A2
MPIPVELMLQSDTGLVKFELVADCLVLMSGHAGSGSNYAASQAIACRPVRSARVMTPGESRSWLRTFGSVEGRAQLVCVPHAGSGASCFAVWRRHLPVEVKLVAVQLPGREDRWREPPMTDIGAAADQLVPQLEPAISARSTVLFGHSMGGLLAHALQRRLEDIGRPAAHLIVSGCHPSDHPVPRRRIGHLGDDDFVAEIRSRGGMPAELLKPQVLKMFLPALRADIRMAESYYPSPDRPLRGPLSAFGGEQDIHVPWEGVLEWRRHTSAQFDATPFQGSHFFVNTARQEVVAAVQSIMVAVMGRSVSPAEKLK